MTKKEIAARYLLFIFGLFCIALGIAFTKHAQLGVSTISSVPNVLSIRFTFLSMGNWLILWNCTMLLAQILLLRKHFHPIQLLQIPLSFLFGFFTDFGLFLVSPIPADTYLVKLLLVFVGIAVLGFGIAVSVTANVVMNSGEAIVKAISDVTHKQFGNVKIAFDIFCVAFSVLLSLLLFNGQILGTREGTLLSAFCTGFVVKFISNRLHTPLNNALKHLSNPS